MQTNAIPSVILGMSANGLSVARSLGRRGVPVIGVDNDSRAPGMASRYLVKTEVSPPVIFAEQDFLDFLIALGRRLDNKPVLFSTADEYVSCVSRNREMLGRYFRFLMPDHALIDMFLDKQKSFQLAREKNIPHPKTFAVTRGSDLETLSRQVPYPCIIKPVHTYLWRERFHELKSFSEDGPDTLIQHCRDIADAGIDVVIQEIIPGPDDNLYELMVYCDRNSESRATFCCHKLRQYPPHFGIGSFVESVNNKDVTESGISFLKKIGYQGIAELEYKKHAGTGSYMFIEANARTSFIGELSVAAGVDIPFIAYRDIAYGDAVAAVPALRLKTYALLNLETDIGSFVRYRRLRELTLMQWARSFLGKKIVHTYYAADDIKPFLRVYGKFFIRLIQKIIRRGAV